MSNLLKNMAPRLMGIDLSADSVKLLELSMGSHGYTVESYGAVGLPDGAIVDHEIKEIELVADALKQVLKHARPKTKQVALALAGASVITKTIQMDAQLSDAELETQIRLDANRYIPYPLEEVSLDFNVIGPAKNDDGMQDILLVACRTEKMELSVDLIEDLGLSVQVVDVEPYALERACQLITHQLPEGGQDKTVLIVDIGSRNTTLTVLHHLSTIYLRDEAFGGLQLTQAIQNQYGVSFAEAGRLKKHGNSEISDLDAKVFSPFRHALVPIIERSLQFFYSATDYSSIDSIVLAGGSAQVPGLSAFVGQQLNISTEVVNPFGPMKFSSQVNKERCMADAPALMVCCGLALRSFL